ncbi:MAG: thiamine phosphate synthase [Candidatus Latescibacterota bacterium]|nr:MAG: thiamine phosphate synthase [Candidatus Latescibacterota bacterium]
MIDFHLYLITDRRLLATENTGARDEGVGPANEEVAREAPPDAAITVAINAAIETACRAGVRAVQLREKDIATRPLYQMALRLRDSTKRHGTKLFVNDRVDIALAARADGVHCPEKGFPVLEAGKSLGHSSLIGASTHSVEGAKRAERDGAHFLTFGPVFETRSKLSYGPPQGLDALRTVAEAVSIPVFAIGGITPGRARSCLECGAQGVAVISAILATDDITGSTHEFKSALGAL